MKSILLTLAILAGAGAAQAYDHGCVPDDGRAWNDISRSQDELRGVCSSERRDYDRAGWNRDQDDGNYGVWEPGYPYGRNHRHNRGCGHH